MPAISKGPVRVSHPMPTDQPIRQFLVVKTNAVPVRNQMASPISVSAAIVQQVIVIIFIVRIFVLPFFW